MTMYILIVALIVISAVSTILVAGKGDANYSSSTKKNYTNLTIMYGVVIILGFIALGIYIRFFS
ncbi:hypothetical protein R4Z10_11705 [Niallia sp. XMNu-256]|uniref:hypothetical protein n=1 Tax=Niallia sp. XMNu-256 TaxID=3082444 RepID=UPI0030CE4751